MRHFLLIAALGVSTLARAENGMPVLNLSGAFETEQERDTRFPARGYSASASLDGDYVSIGANYSNLRTDEFDDGASSGRLEYEAFGGDVSTGFSLTDRFGVGISAAMCARSHAASKIFRACPASESTARPAP
jgi:hypothetical protein